MSIGIEPDGGAGVHSTFWTCSRNFSSSAFNNTTSREMSLSLALEPMVLISRLISWDKKSSVRPTGSRGFDAVVELLEVALQPGQFLRNIAAVGEIKNLFDKPLVVQAGGFQAGGLDAGQQLVPVTLHGPGRASLHTAHAGAQMGDARLSDLWPARRLRVRAFSAACPARP